MNWMLILLLAVAGLGLGALGIFGLTEGKEWWVMAIEVLLFALILALKAPGKFFKHGFLTSLISSIASSIMMFLLYDTYVANNPEYAAKIAEVPESLNMRVTMLIGGPISGAISGLVLGGLTVLLAKFLRDKEPAAASDTANPTNSTPL